MLLKSLCIFVLLISSLNLSAIAQKSGDKQIGFTVPAAPWTFMLDGENFTVERQQIKSGGKYGYFLLNNDKSHITVSLFIEPAVKCKTSKECRDMVLKLGNPAWGSPQNLVSSEIGDVSFFEFFRPTVQNQPVQMLDMYAQFVKDGFWVDLHISKVLYKKEDHALFENIIKSVKFELKDTKPLEIALKTAEVWMPLWDAGKYDETYNLLAIHTKKTIDRKTWFVYWTAARKPLGNLKYRKLVSSEYIKSLVGVPDQEGATFQYKSSFENKESVLETFGMMREKDGSWRVANYITD